MPELMYSEDDMERFQRAADRMEDQLIKENNQYLLKIRDLENELLTLRVLVDSCETCRRAEVAGVKENNARLKGPTG